ncbi:MAG: DMT family transporter [Alphaproteobacteria bacterium]
MSPIVRNFVLLAFLSVLWGSSFLLFKIAVESIPPLSVAAGRQIVAVLALVLVLGRRGGRLPRSASLWYALFLVAIFGWSLPSFLIAWGEERIDSSLAAIIVAATPVFTVLMVRAVARDEGLSARGAAGLGLGFAGVILLIGPEAVLGMGETLSGQLALAGTAVSYALSNVFARRLDGVAPTVTGTAVMLCSAVALVPLCLVVDRPWGLAPSAESLAAMVAIGLFSSALGVVVYFRLLAYTGAIFVSLVAYLVPPVGVALGATLLGEEIGWIEVAALALILLGVAGTSRGARRAPTGGSAGSQP